MIKNFINLLIICNKSVWMVSECTCNCVVLIGQRLVLNRSLQVSSKNPFF